MDEFGTLQEQYTSILGSITNLPQLLLTKRQTPVKSLTTLSATIDATMAEYKIFSQHLLLMEDLKQVVLV